MKPILRAAVAALFICGSGAAQTQSKPMIDARDYGSLSSAFSACGSSSCAVVRPAGSPGGDLPLTGWPANVGILDLRQSTNRNFYPIGLETAPFQFYKLMNSVPANTNDYSSTGYFEFRQVGGGNYSYPGHKSSYSTLVANSFLQGQGQNFGVKSLTYGRGRGETFAFYGEAVQMGPMDAGGVEPAAAFRGYSGDCVSCNAQDAYTVTVASFANGALSWVEPGYEFAFGENRHLVKNQDQYTSGTIASVSGSPMTFVGSGTAWATKFGAGAHADLCFSMNELDNGGYRFWFPVTSIADNTHLTVSYKYQVTEQSYPLDFKGAGEYRLAHCSVVASSVNSGAKQVTVSGYAGWKPGDTFTQWMSPVKSVFADNVQATLVAPPVNNAPPILINRVMGGGRGHWRLMNFTGSGSYQHGWSVNLPMDPATATTDALIHVTGAIPASANIAWLNAIPGGAYNLLNQKTSNGSFQVKVNESPGVTRFTESAGSADIVINAHSGVVTAGGFSGDGTGLTGLTPAPVSVPAHHSDACKAGTWAHDASYFYVCHASGDWRRIAWDSAKW